jgi:hypothetical protein
MEWRRGINGDAGTYIFNPKPNVTRASPGKRVAEIVIPLRDGEVVQSLGHDKRTIQLTGILYNTSHSWDETETLRNNLRDGIGTGPGQLHIISPQRHIRYDGQIDTAGISFAEQTRANLQDYAIAIIVPNSLEINVTETLRTINSDAKVI